MFQKLLWELWRRSGYIKFVEQKLERNPLIHKNVEKSENLILNAQQKEAYDQIEFMLENVAWNNWFTERQKFTCN